MDPELFHMATSGNVDALRRRKRKEKDNAFLLQRTHKMNDTALHIASTFGHVCFATEIINHRSELLLVQNSRDDTALHNAARAGHKDVVHKLIECAAEQNKKEEMLGMVNKEGNTILHEAATNSKGKVVELLMREMPNLALEVNSAGASPLYVAAEKGCLKSVVHILSVDNDPEKVQCEGPLKRTPLHAAVIRQHLRITQTLIEKRKVYITKEDESGNYPIHYAAAIGNLQMVREILQVDISAGYQQNRKQQSPFYVASSYGHVNVIKELVKCCPDPCFSVDKKGCNALHVAAKRGHLEVVKYILGSEYLLELINEPNEAGNTPLQLAISKGRVPVSIFLIKNKRVDVNVKNKKCMTALDIAESQDDKVTKKFEKIVICNALIKAKGMRGRMRLGNRSQKLEERIISYKDMFRVVPTIAALIMTVSFAAAFTIPGGFNNHGKAFLGKKCFLWLFIITDAVALFASIIVGLALLLIANLDNTQCNVDIFIAAHSISIKLMGISLVSLALAFLFGLSSIVPIALVGLLVIVLLALLGLVLLRIGFLPWFTPLNSYLKLRIKDKLFSFLCPCSSHESDPKAVPKTIDRLLSTNPPESPIQVKSQTTNPPSSPPPIEVQGRNPPQVSSQVEIQTTNESQSPASIEIQHTILLWNSVSKEIPHTNQPQSSVSLLIPILDLIRSQTGTSLSSEAQTTLSNSLQNLNLLVNLPVNFNPNLISTQNPVLQLIRYLPQQTTSPQSAASSEIPHPNQPERLVSAGIGDAVQSSIPSSTIPHTTPSFTSPTSLTQSSTPLQYSSAAQVHSYNPFTLTKPSQSPAPILHINQPERSVPNGIGGALQSSNTEASLTSSTPLAQSSTSLQNSNPAQVHNRFPTLLPAFQQSDTSSNGPRYDNRHSDASSNRGRNVHLR